MSSPTTTRCRNAGVSGVEAVYDRVFEDAGNNGYLGIMPHDMMGRRLCIGDISALG